MNWQLVNLFCRPERRGDQGGTAGGRIGTHNNTDLRAVNTGESVIHIGQIPCLHRAYTVYAPGFRGKDGFTYEVNDGLTNGPPASVERIVGMQMG